MLSPTTLRFAIDKRAGSSISKPKIGADRYQRQNGTGKPEAENVANVMSGNALSGINCWNGGPQGCLNEGRRLAFG
jgi:hypothetical protein